MLRQILIHSLVSAIALTIVGGAFGSTSIASDVRQPNVILIMADDVSWEAFGCYGAQDYSTPNIDRMARQGLRFNHCYSTPICTTSRVQLMTGKYNFRNYTHFGYLNPKEKTFGQMMKSAGYRTAIAGKWQLNGLSNNLPGFKDNNRPYAAGFDEYMLWQLTIPKTKNTERFWSPVLEHNGTVLSAEDNSGKYGPDLLCDFICSFIERNKTDPFFVYYPMTLVHDPFVPTPDTIGSADRSQKANKQQKGKAKENFVAMVNYMDQVVGRIVDKVEDLELLEDTVILFTADNGTNTQITSRWNDQSIRGGKGGMTDMGTHVPLIAMWKGHTPEGNQINDLVDFTDFYPTLMDLARVTPNEQDPIDGFSFAARLKNQKPLSSRDWVLCHYQPYWNKQPGQFARTQTFKLYRDGRYFSVPSDLQEQNDMQASIPAGPAAAAHKNLERLLQNCPPAPTTIGNRNTVERPVFPNWKSLRDPLD